MKLSFITIMMVVHTVTCEDSAAHQWPFYNIVNFNLSTNK